MQNQKYDKRVQKNLRKNALLFSGALIISIMTTPASAVVTFTYTYTDPVGVGFNAAGALGASRRTALEQTGAIVSSFFPSLTATINMSVDGAETTDGVLAAAGSEISTACTTTGFGRGDVGLKMLGGADPNPGGADGTVTVNFQDFIWGLGDNVAAGEFDFKSTMAHELLHATGFSHSISDDGSDPCGGNPVGWFDDFDRHLGSNTAHFINASFVTDVASWLAAYTGGAGSGGLHWRGAAGTAANGGNPIPLFSPNPIQQGSSGSHLDDDFYTGVALLMEAATVDGLGTRTLSPIEVGIFTDIGLITQAPPPPPPPPPPAAPKTSFLSAIYYLLFDDD